MNGTKDSAVSPKAPSKSNEDGCLILDPLEVQRLVDEQLGKLLEEG